MMRHLAIIADGNRRWAAQNGLPKEAGYLQGLTAIENCCLWAIRRGIPYLSVYCFSTENWKRTETEVSLLMDLARSYFGQRADWYREMGVCVRFLGRKDRLAKDLVEKMQRMEAGTSAGSRLTLTICVDYGGRDEIAAAAQQGARTEEEIDSIIMGGVPAPDMILRTGGEMRLSNFMLWQAAYAELSFLQDYFPDLDSKLLDKVLEDYNERNRNYGR